MKSQKTFDQMIASIQWKYARPESLGLRAMEERLQQALASASTITYSELVEGITFHEPQINGGAPYQIDGKSWKSSDYEFIGEFLNYLSIASYCRSGILVSALVTVKKTGMPGAGFFEFARNPEMFGTNSTGSDLEFWQQLMRSIRETQAETGKEVPSNNRDYSTSKQKRLFSKAWTRQSAFEELLHDVGSFYELNHQHKLLVGEYPDSGRDLLNHFDDLDTALDQLRGVMQVSHTLTSTDLLDAVTLVQQTLLSNSQAVDTANTAITSVESHVFEATLSGALSSISLCYKEHLNQIQQIINFFGKLIEENPADTTRIAEVRGYIETLNEVDQKVKQLRAPAFPSLDQYIPPVFAERHGTSATNIRKHLKAWSDRNGNLKFVRQNGRWIITDREIAKRFDDWLWVIGRKS